MDSPDRPVRHDGDPRRDGQLLRDVPAVRAERGLPLRQGVEGQAVALAVAADPGMYSAGPNTKRLMELEMY